MFVCSSPRKESAAFAKGFKRRVSISPSDRSRWTGDNDLVILLNSSLPKMGEMKRVA